MNAISILTKETILYSTIIVAGMVLLFKKLFERKTRDKKFYEKHKKNLVRKAKLFFTNTSSKQVEIKAPDALIEFSAESVRSNKYLKMKNFLKKISMKYDQVESRPETESKGAKAQIKRNKKDEIFYYLLNNVSQMMIANNSQEEGNTLIDN